MIHVRYDLNKKEMLKYFSISISSKYAAFLFALKNNKVSECWTAYSGADLNDWGKTKLSKLLIDKEYTPQSIFKYLEKSNIKPYIDDRITEDTKMKKSELRRIIKENIRSLKEDDLEEKFNKIIKALSKIKWGITVICTKKYYSIDIIVGTKAPSKIPNDIIKILDKTKIKWGLNTNVNILGMSSDYTKKIYDGIKKINGGYNQY